MVARGQVWWFEDEDIPRRPVLVLTRTAVTDRLTHVVAVPATTVIRHLPTEVTLSAADGMPQECVLTLDNVGQFRTSLCTELITELSDARMQDVCDALLIATQCVRG